MKPILLLATSLLLAPYFSHAQSTPPPPPPAAGAQVEVAEWFAGIGGEQKGPFTAAQIKTQITAGTITSKTLIWKDGMSAWQAAGSNTTFSPTFAGPTSKMTPAVGTPPPLQSTSTQPPSSKKFWEADNLPDMLKNASKELMPVEEVTLEKLKEIFDRASFSTEIRHAEKLLRVTDASGGATGVTGVTADPLTGIFMVLKSFDFKAGTPELTKIKFANDLNLSSGGTIAASTKLDVDNALALSHVRYIPQGISEWSILFTFEMFNQGGASLLAELKAEEILK